jgi:hypothetical protein
MSIAQKILANPAKYSLQQLQQGVENGIIPAYIAIPLIQEKVQQQKMAQQSMQGMQDPQGQQQQMPIAQAVMQEAQGLSTLPTNLPQSYAGGGIVAFADGGDVERYQSKGLVDPENMTQEERDRQAMRDTLRKLGAAGMDIGTLPVRGVAGAAESVITRPLRALGVPIPYLPESFYGGDRSSMTPYMDQLRANEPQAAAPAPAAAPIAPPVAERKPPVDQVKPPQRAASTGTPAGGISDLTSAAPKSNLAGTTKTLMDEFTKRDESRDLARDKAIQDAEGKVTGKAFEGLEASLRKEAEEAGANKSQAKYMAMFKAGLAMMAGTSRNAFENIGKGAMVGAEDYQAAVKDLKKAQKENERQLAYIEQARRAEDIGNRDRAVDRLDKANTAASNRDKFGVSAIMNATGKDAEISADIWKTGIQAQTSRDVAKIGAGATLGAAAMRANQREGITPYQLARLRQDAEKQVDPNAIRAQLVQQLKLSKPPKPGADPTFEQRFQQAYEAAIMDRVNRSLGTPGSSGAGFQLPQGYKLLGSE